MFVDFKKKTIRLITVLIAVCLMVTFLPAVSSAEDEPVSENSSYPGTEYSSDDIKPDGSLDGLRYINSEDLIKNGAVKRLPGNETLNSYAFLNYDGTESVVIFPENIKYVDRTGKTVEKDLTLTKTVNGGYTVKANDYDVVFPENIDDGISFSYLDGTVRIIPKNENGSSKASVENNAILYREVFGKDTAVRYTPLLNGIKEDIILDNYTGVDSFEFLIDAEGLVLSRREEGLVFENEKQEAVIVLGEILAYDANGNIAKGSLSAELYDKNTAYSVTISIEKEFLTDPKTVYPVTIDPPIYESSDGSAIQDSPIFDGTAYQNSCFGTYLIDYVGPVSPYGNGRTAMWLYGLENNPIYKTLDAEEILSVKINVRGTTSGSPVYVNLYRISSNVTWGEYTVTYNNVGSFDTFVNKGTYLSTTSRTEFDITSFAKGWKNLSYTNTMRVIFTTGTGSSSWFYSSHAMNNSGEVDNRPYITFTYQPHNLMDEGTYYIRNRHIDKFLQPTNGSSSANAGLELNAFSGSNSQKWKLISHGNGYYTIKNVNNGYVLSVPSGSYSTYDVQLIQAQDTQADGQLWRIYMTSYCGFAIKPRSACGPNDGTGWSDRTMSVADGNEGNGALVTQRPYVYNNSFKDEWYLMPTDISETVSYEIENSQLGSYLRPEDGVAYTNNVLELWEEDNSYSQKWFFTAAGGGYYKISPYYNSSLAITVASGSETAENGGVIQYLYTADNPRQQWFIYKVPHGYALKARSAGINNLVLSVSEGNLGNGAVVSQRAYVNNLSYKEEWILHGPSTPPIAPVIEDGVYYIGRGAVYFTATQSKAYNGTQVIVSTLYSSLASLAQRSSQMWKIKYLGSGKYSVRPLHKLDMGLTSSQQDSRATITDIGTNDVAASLPDYAQWSIEEYQDPTGVKYVFRRPSGSGAALASIGTTTYPQVLVSTYLYGEPTELWTLTRVATSSIPKGIVFYRRSDGTSIEEDVEQFLSAGDSLTLAQMDIKVGVIDASNISQNVNWTVPYSDTRFISVGYTSGTLHAIKYSHSSKTVICSRFIQNTTYTKLYSVENIHLINGTYYVKNRRSGKYLGINGNNITQGTPVKQWKFNENESRKWVFSYIGNGYYSIKLAGPTEDYYLGIQNDSGEVGATVVLRTGNLTEGMKWKIYRTATGAFKIIPKTGMVNDCVLAVGPTLSLINQNGSDAKQLGYNMDDNYADEWNILPFDLEYWHANTLLVEYWSGYPRIYHYNYETSLNSIFEAGIDNALDEWLEALSFSVIYVSSEDQADIKCYGRNREYVEDKYGEDPPETLLGFAETDCRTDDPCLSQYGSNQRTVRRINSAEIYIIMENDNLEKCKSVITHEFGHAFGYYGHALSENSVMYETMNLVPVTVLSEAEKAHLRQIYVSESD
ncbi:MAG: RICIN domain-containing protein [Clostridia bacterium]|nr:RICIN domain-containing protein [Clostridia bacterium]